MKGKLDKIEEMWDDISLHKKIHKQYKKYLSVGDKKEFVTKDDELKHICDFICTEVKEIDKFVLKFYISQRYPLRDESEYTKALLNKQKEEKDSY